jgi:sulfur carrier protein ThiS adenylyltransferase
MKIKVNERATDVPAGTTLAGARRLCKPDADVVILNGGPAREEHPLSEGDEVVLIRRGETPSREELEALMVARHTPGVHARVKQASVGIAGLGGLGSAIAVALARVGLGRLVLADFDVVEPSNLNRQQYFIDQIGQLKTEALAANLRRINPYVTCEIHSVRLTPENIPAIFGSVNVMVEAFDRADQKVMLLGAFARARPDTPLVSASGLAGYGPESSVGVRKVGRNVYVVGDLVTAAGPGTGLMAPRVGVAASMQANLTLRLLLGDTSL